MISWTISEMQRKETNGFVTHVWYRVTNADGEYSSVTTGECDYIQEENTFTPYDDLEQDAVIDWVQESLGKETVAAIEASLDAQIVAKKAVVRGIPWNR